MNEPARVTGIEASSDLPSAAHLTGWIIIFLRYETICSAERFNASVVLMYDTEADIEYVARFGVTVVLPSLTTLTASTLLVPRPD